ncbi:MAG: GspH/FimT family protein [Pseudomonadota bacterium]
MKYSIRSNTFHNSFPKFLSSYGFTLIELLISISILLITTLMTLPSLSSILTNSRQDGQIATLMSNLQLTRKEAIYKNRNMLMCKSSDQLTCSKDAQWHEGWVIFYDANNNKQRDEDEKIVFAQAKTNHTIKVVYNSFGGSNNYVYFYNRGYSHTNGTFTICNPLGTQHTKTIVISRTGRVRLDEKPKSSYQKKCLAQV